MRTSTTIHLLLLCALILAVALLSAEAKRGGRGRGRGSSGARGRGRSRWGAVLKGGVGLKRKLARLANALRDGAAGESADDDDGNSLRRVHRGRGNSLRMQQFFRGVKVFGARLYDKQIEGGRIELFANKQRNRTATVDVQPTRLQSGTFIEDLVAEFPRLNRGQLTSKVVRMRNKLRKEHRHHTISDLEAEPVIYYDKRTDKPSLAVHVSLMAERGDNVTMPNVIYDQDGVELKRWDNLQRSYRNSGTGPGGNPTVGRWTYGSGGRPNFRVDASGSECELETENVRTVHAHGRWDGSKEPYQFDCFHQDADGVNGAYSPINDVHHNAETVAKMFKQWYDRSPSSHMPLTLIAHYRSNYENAFYKGSGTLYFGNGGSSLYPLTTLDIVAHEIGHAVTVETASNLVYSGQSGGINEAFSDMTAMAALYYAEGKRVSWKIGDRVMKSGSGQLRCVDRPSRCDARSIDTAADYSYGLDVHYSSGVYNRMFYLLSEKLANGVWDAYDLMYAANKYTWSPDTSFAEGAEGLLKVLDYLHKGYVNFGYNYEWIKHGDLVEVFSQVGINCVPSSIYGWDCTA